MAFESLVRELVRDPVVLKDIEDLLAIKRRSGEQEWLPARPVLNAYLESLMQQLGTANPTAGHPDTTLLDDLLAETLLGSAKR
jgi:hypothetical protein